MKSEAELESPPSADEAQGASHTLDGAVTLDKAEQLQRGLKSRHIQFMALGGA